MKKGFIFTIEALLVVSILLVFLFLQVNNDTPPKTSNISLVNINYGSAIYTNENSTITENHSYCKDYLDINFISGNLDLKKYCEEIK